MKRLIFVVVFFFTEETVVSIEATPLINHKKRCCFNCNNAWLWF